MNVFKKYRFFHLLLWGVMILYFIFAPNLLPPLLLKVGKPVPPDNSPLSETTRASFDVDALESYVEGNEQLYRLNGWGYIIPKEGKSVHALIKEISLVSQDQRYVFPVEIKYHGLSEKEPGAESVDRITLGFSALIAADTIQPGKYRIGIIFHDPSTGLFYYWDKPARYLIKTPNLLNLE